MAPTDTSTQPMGIYTISAKTSTILQHINRSNPSSQAMDSINMSTQPMGTNTIFANTSGISSPYINRSNLSSLAMDPNDMSTQLMGIYTISAKTSTILQHINRSNPSSQAMDSINMSTQPMGTNTISANTSGISSPYINRSSSSSHVMDRTDTSTQPMGTYTISAKTLTILQRINRSNASSQAMSLNTIFTNTINSGSISSQDISFISTLSQPMSSMAGTTESNQKLLVLEASLTYTEKVFDVELYHRQSSKFLKMKNDVEKDIKTAYNQSNTLLSVTVIAFKPGSIVCDALLYFQNSTSGDISYFKQILMTYGINTGKFKVSEFKSYTENDEDDDDDEVIFGLDWWQIGLIIAGVVAFILLITIIALCVSISIYSLLFLCNHLYYLCK